MKHSKIKLISCGAWLACSLPIAWAQGLPNYQPLTPISHQDWGASNQTVHDIGGWRAYLKQAQADMKADITTPIASAVSAAGKAQQLTLEQALDAYLQLHRLSKNDVQNPELHEATFNIKQAWVNAVAAQNTAKLTQMLHRNAGVTMELSQRMVAVGNRSQMQHAVVHLAYARSAQQLALTEHESRQKRLELQRLIRSNVAIDLPATLPALPQTLPQLAQLTGAQTSRLQIYDTLQTHTLAYQLAQHASKHIVPIQQTIVDETVLRYNGMLLSTFDILNEHRALVQAQIEAVKAAEQYYLIDAALHSTLAGIPKAFSLAAGLDTATSTPNKH